MSTLVLQKTASLIIQSFRGLLVAACILLAAILLAVTIGESSISPQTVYQTLANKLLGAQYAVDLIDAGILWEYRLSRAVIASCCGAALAVSGVILQSLLRNVLVDPYILGISAGASAGAVAVTIVGIGAGMLSMSAGAFLGALLSFGLVLALSRVTGQIILAGIAGAQLFHSL